MPPVVEHRTEREGTLSGCQITTTAPVTSPTAPNGRGAILEADVPRQYRTAGYGRGRVPRGSGIRDIEQQQPRGPAAEREYEPASAAGDGSCACARLVALDVWRREDRSRQQQGRDRRRRRARRLGLSTPGPRSDRLLLRIAARQRARLSLARAEQSAADRRGILGVRTNGTPVFGTLVERQARSRR